MNHQNTKTSGNRKRIADEIMARIGKSVILVFLIVAAAVICMAGWTIITSKEKELTLESQAASNQLNAFLDQYTRGAEQLAVHPDIKHIMNEIKSGNNISKAQKMDAVLDYLVNIANTDTENVMAVWSSDLDSSSLIQSDGYISNDDWDITGRGWYGCITEKKTVLTEPYIDSSTGKMILSAAAPVYDDTGAVLGAVGFDISLDHITKILQGYKVGRNGYLLLLSENGTFLYHPNNDFIQKNINEVSISQNVVDAVSSKRNEFLKYKVEGTTKYGFLEMVGDTGYLVLSSMPMSEYYSNDNCLNYPFCNWSLTYSI